MNTLRITFLILVTVLNTVYCQTLERTCGTPEPTSEQISRIEQASRLTYKSNVELCIPIVFHVVYENEAENVNYDLLESQVRVLNEDFNNANLTLHNWGLTAADVGITFYLDSVIRKPTTRTSFTVGNTVKYESPIVDPYTFLNIWVCDIANSTLGFASYPYGNRATDGIVIDYLYVGYRNSWGSYSRGRTGTHEVGHWLGLRHIWGSGCGFDDGIADTPDCDSPTSGCPLGALACDNVTPKMIENYMDYSFDRCMSMFSQGQKNVMLNVMADFRSGMVCESDTTEPAPTCTELVLNPTCAQPADPTRSNGLQAVTDGDYSNNGRFLTMPYVDPVDIYFDSLNAYVCEVDVYLGYDAGNQFTGQSEWVFIFADGILVASRNIPTHNSPTNKYTFRIDRQVTQLVVRCLGPRGNNPAHKITEIDVFGYGQELPEPTGCPQISPKSFTYGNSNILRDEGGAFDGDTTTRIVFNSGDVFLTMYFDEGTEICEIVSYDGWINGGTTPTNWQGTCGSVDLYYDSPVEEEFDKSEEDPKAVFNQGYLIPAGPNNYVQLRYHNMTKYNGKVKMAEVFVYGENGQRLIPKHQYSYPPVNIMGQQIDTLNYDKPYFHNGKQIMKVR